MPGFVRSLIVFITIFCGFILETGCSREKILRLKDKETIRWYQMIQDVKDKKIILIGKLQDEPKHQEYQLRVIKDLHEQGIPISIGLEMFRAKDQAVLDGWVAGNLTLDQFLSSNPYKPLPVYKDIFLFSKERKVPLIGLTVPAEIPIRVARTGFGSLSEGEIQQLPAGISCNVDDTYREYIKRFYPSLRSGKEFTKFCEAQLIQDNAMALYTLKYIEKYPRSTVIILSEYNRAWKRATPRQIERLHRSHTICVILPELTKIERSIMTGEDADFLILK